LFPVYFGASDKIHLVLLFTLHNTKNIAYHIEEVLIFYAYKLMVMGNSKNLLVFKNNFVIILKSQKSDSRKTYMFYSKCDNVMCIHWKHLTICMHISRLPVSFHSTYSGHELVADSTSVFLAVCLMNH